MPKKSTKPWPSHAYCVTYDFTSGEQREKKPKRTTQEMRGDIVVAVLGMPASGKSAVAHCIADILKTIGLDTTVIDDNGCGKNDETPFQMAMTWKKRLRSIVGRGRHVRVRTYQVNRSQREVKVCR